MAQEFVRFGQAFLQFTRDMCTICHAGMRRLAELWLSRGAAAAVQVLKDSALTIEHGATRTESLVSDVHIELLILVLASDSSFRLLAKTYSTPYSSLVGSNLYAASSWQDEPLFATIQFLSLNVFSGAQDIFTKKFGPCEYFLFVEKDTLDELAQELKIRLKKWAKYLLTLPVQ